MNDNVIVAGGFRRTVALAILSNSLLALEGRVSLTSKHSADTELGTVGYKSEPAIASIFSLIEQRSAAQHSKKPQRKHRTRTVR